MPIEDTLAGISKAPDSLVHPLKALSPIELTPEPNESEVKPEQPEKTDVLITVIAAGIVRLPDSDLQF